MTRRAVLLAVLAGCNQVFGLTPTVASGSVFYDAPIDAPFACPPIGTNLPAFNGVLVQQVLQECSQYSPSYTSGRATASCNGGITEYVCEGPLDQMLAYAIAEPGIQSQPRLTPDGNTLYAHDNSVSFTASAWTRSGTTWVRDQAHDLGPIATATGMSSFVRGPSGDHVLFQTLTNAGTGFSEWGNEGGTWHETSTHPPTELGVSGVEGIMLTSDGLRALVYATLASGVNETLYTDRPALDAPFRAAQKIEGIFGAAQDASLADDCSRIYFTGLGSVFYVQQ